MSTYIDGSFVNTCSETTVIEPLYQALELVNNYGDLINSNVCDFFTKQLWQTAVPSNVRNDLKNLTYEEILCLPEELLASDKVEDSVYSVESSDTEEGYTLSTPEFVKALPQKEDANSLHTFITKKDHFRERNSLSELVTSIKECLIDTAIARIMQRKACLLNGFRKSSCGPEKYQKSISQKKKHEVEKMAELCCNVFQRSHCDMVVDVGSGKGYLGSYLCNENNINVLGLEASQINVHGAGKRQSSLQKEDKSLNVKTQADYPQTMKKWQNEIDCKNVFCENETTLTESESLHFETESVFCKSGITDSMIESVFENNIVNTNDEKDSMEKELVNSTVKLTSTDCNENTQLCNTLPMTKFMETEFIQSSSTSENSHSEVEKNIKSDIHDIVNDLRHSSETNIANLNKCVGKEFEYGFNNRHCDTAEHLKIFKTINIEVTEDTDILCCIESTCSQCPNRVLLTGLHACGGLTSSILKLFVKDETVKSTCVVGCCYHLMGENSDESFPMSSYLKTRGFKLSHAALNLAAQSVHKLAANKKVQGELFFNRCLLQVILRDLFGISDVEKRGYKLRGMEKKSKSTYDYMTHAFKKLNLQSEQLTPDFVNEYLTRFEQYRSDLIAFCQLRFLFAPCLESIVLLDRYLWLINQDVVKTAQIVKLFDPNVSPRCYVIVATK